MAIITALSYFSSQMSTVLILISLQNCECVTNCRTWTYQANPYEDPERKKEYNYDVQTYVVCKSAKKNNEYIYISILLWWKQG